MEPRWVQLPREFGGVSSPPKRANGVLAGSRGCSSGPGRGLPGITLHRAVVLPVSVRLAHPCQHCHPSVLRHRPSGVQEVNFICVFSPAACWQPALPTPTCPQSDCSVHQILSKLTIHFMYFNLGRTFIWLKFPFRGLECAFHTQAEMMCSSFVRRSLVYKDSN